MSKYKKGDKFVIKITDVYTEEKGYNIPKYGIDDMLLIWESTLDKLERYDPDEKANADFDAGYNSGLNDAWEAARKIVCEIEDGGLRMGALRDIFGTGMFSTILRESTASEAVSKIRAYEDKLINVGDEVIFNKTKMIVTHIAELHVDGVDSAGSIYSVLRHQAEKTGRHFSEIENVLKQMKGE